MSATSAGASAAAFRGLPSGFLPAGGVSARTGAAEGSCASWRALAGVWAVEAFVYLRLNKQHYDWGTR